MGTEEVVSTIAALPCVQEEESQLKQGIDIDYGPGKVFIIVIAICPDIELSGLLPLCCCEVQSQRRVVCCMPYIASLCATYGLTVSAAVRSCRS